MQITTTKIGVIDSVIHTLNSHEINNGVTTNKADDAVLRNDFADFFTTTNAKRSHNNVSHRQITIGQPFYVVVPEAISKHGRTKKIIAISFFLW